MRPTSTARRPSGRRSCASRAPRRSDMNEASRSLDAGRAGTGGWQDELYDLLRRHGVTQFAYVPDAGHQILIDRSLADPDVRSVPLTTEEEGVALIAGADLGGARAVLLMQSCALRT